MGQDISRTWAFRLRTSLWVFLGLLYSGEQVLAASPNFLIILADDLGIGDVGCFGNTTLRTPNLDKLARDGIRLTQHLAAASVCTPSRSAMLTGRYPVRTGMAPDGDMSVITFQASPAGLPQSEVTFAELVKEAGYSTALIGKWHLGLNCRSVGDNCHHPMKQGFDYYYGLPLTNLRDFGGEGDYVIISHAPYLRVQIVSTALVIIICIFYLYKRSLMSAFPSSILLTLAIASATFVLRYLIDFTPFNSILMRGYEIVEQPIVLNTLTKRFVLEGQEFLQKRHEDGQPFLLFMSWSHVHTYLGNMKEFSGKSNHGRYGDAVEELDWGTGQILDTLDTLGFTNNTLVYFTSDNGGHVEETDVHGERNGGYNGIYRGGKSHGAADGGIRVPTIVRWPGFIPADTLMEEPSSQMDLFPTIARIIDRPLPPNKTIDGKDLLPLLLGQQQVSSHKFLYHYFGQWVNAVRYRPRTGISVYKFVLAKPNYLPTEERCAFVCGCYDAVFLEQPELYDVTNDPEERNPLDYSTNSDYKDIVDRMEESLQLHIHSLEEVPQQLTFSNLIWRPWLQPCCNFPFCQCQDPKFNISS